MSSQTISQTQVPFSRSQTPGANVQIGFCGLGAMGYFMARNLANHRASLNNGYFPLLVYNRTVAKAERLATEIGKDKVRIAESPSQLASMCDIIVTNLASDDVVKSIYEEFAKALAVRTIYSMLNFRILKDAIG
jgi:3-hydroxyisobutyrate dehydrogenase-like beta-hydroxyacid dehydrogenase